MWPEEEEDRCCEGYHQADYVQNQLECQQQCTSSMYDCVGICYSYRSDYTYSCFVCENDNLQPVNLDFGFYRNPGIVNACKA